MTDVLKHNGRAWDQQSKEGSSRWVQPVSAEAIARALAGDWSVILTPNKTVPRAWFPDQLQGLEMLCLASGGGQQAPILAAAGAQVNAGFVLKGFYEDRWDDAASPLNAYMPTSMATLGELPSD